MQKQFHKKDEIKDNLKDNILNVVEQFILHFEEVDKQLKKKEEDESI